MTAVGHGRFVSKKQNYNFRIATAEDFKANGFTPGGQYLYLSSMLTVRKKTWELITTELVLHLVAAIEEQCLSFDAEGNRTTEVKRSVYSTVREQLADILPPKFDLVAFDRPGMMTMIVFHAQEVVHLNNRLEDVREGLSLAFGYHLTNFVWSYSIGKFMSAMERTMYIKQLMHAFDGADLINESAYSKIFSNLDPFEVNAGIKGLLPSSGGARYLPLDNSPEKKQVLERHDARSKVMWLDDFQEHGDIRCKLPGKLPALREFARDNDVLAKIINHYVGSGHFIEIEEGNTL